MPDGLRITGGAGGTMADVESIRAFAGSADALAADLARAALAAVTLGSDPSLVTAGALDPAGSVAVHAGLAALTGRLSSCAAAARGYAGSLVAAGEVYRLADTDVTTLAHEVWAGLGPAAAAPALGAALVGAGVWVGGRAAAEALAVTPWAAERLAGGADPRDVARGSARVVLDATQEQLSDDAEGLLEWMVRHPDATREALATLPMLLDPVLPADPQGVGSGPGGQGVQAAGLTATIMALGRSQGYFVEGRVDVTKVETFQRRGPTSVADLLERSKRLTGPRGSLQGYTELKGGAVVDRLPATGGGPARWVVYVTPTNDWGVTGGPYASDLTSNMGLVAKQGMRPGGPDPDAVEGAARAMRRAGVRPGEPVLLVGFSQGGLTAATLAADPQLRREFDVQGVLTAGSPVSEFELPEDVQVLSLEHRSDLVPEADGSRNPDRPSWTTVEERDLDPEVGNPVIADRVAGGELFAGHYLDGYFEFGGQVEASAEPSVRAWRDQMAPFLTGEQEVTTTEVTVRRQPP